MVEQYVPGTCNTAPAEIPRRMRVGHVGLAATAVLAVLLLALDAPRAWRLTLAIPAGVAAAGYLQAGMRFCFEFGFRGVYNFEALGRQERVIAEEARAQARRRALAMAAASGAIGLAFALL